MSDADRAATSGPEPPVDGMRTFFQILVNTAVANVTTSYLWFALTFWVYLETRSVLATGIIGGAYMLLVAAFGMVFGSIVDRSRKLQAMVAASIVTLAAFALAGVIFFLLPESTLLDLGAPWFWIFAGIILFGAVVENMRNIALSTTVTLLVPKERHANANGLVGTVVGIAFIVTSVFSGISIGFLGMGWTLVIAIAITAGALIHLLTLRSTEGKPEVDPTQPFVDIRGSLSAVRATPGLFALIVFSTFNNLIGGVYLALMDPYGLELLEVQWWGVVFGVAATGFIVGGAIVAKFGLGRNPIRTMLILVAGMGVLGSLFTLRDWWLLFAIGIWLYMTLIPGVEAAEQTVIQRVVPYRSQGRVFGFAQAFESAAAPVTAFMIAPIAEFFIIPYMESDAGREGWSWLLGEGQARGIALVFFFAGIVMVVIALLAFTTRSYRRISASFSALSVTATSSPTADAVAERSGDVLDADSAASDPVGMGLDHDADLDEDASPDQDASPDRDADPDPPVTRG